MNVVTNSEILTVSFNKISKFVKKSSSVCSIHRPPWRTECECILCCLDSFVDISLIWKIMKAYLRRKRCYSTSLKSIGQISTGRILIGQFCPNKSNFQGNDRFLCKTTEAKIGGGTQSA